MTTYESPEAQEKAEWVAYFPEIKTAIEAGYLDEFLGQIQAMCSIRRGELGAPIKKVRTAALATPKTSNVIHHHLLEPADEFPESPHGDIEVAGKKYPKWRLKSYHTPFIFRSDVNSQIDGFIVRIKKINRVNGVLDILGHIDPHKDNLVQTGNINIQGINAALPHIVKCVVQHNQDYGVR